ncbi:hypothetical protein [Glycomyces sp. YM15]|uniref:hypothetical protein n=1 Tax=Glycomyces sp. YM15 TaxID=2800446 RepID=UPI0019631831|nr:hypothetical protein [Glycomyces sp. YM15]
MPESIRTLLHDIGGDDPGPSRDLAAGAVNRARSIGRRRFAAGAIGAVTALALAGAGTAGLINGRDNGGTPPAGDPTTVEDTESFEEETGEWVGCGARPQDWAGNGVEIPERGDSGTERDLEGALPDRMSYRVLHDEFGESTWQFTDAGEIEGIDITGDFEYYPAPDGNRVVAVDRADGCGAAYIEIGFDSNFEGAVEFSIEPVHCPIAWSPDSDKLLFTEPTVFEDAKTYVLNVSSGELTELSRAQGDAFCAGEWLADSERIWSGRTAILNLDGTVAQELPALAESLETENWLDAGISADGGEACFDEFEESQGDGRGRFCDVYVDTATGQELTLPVDGENRQVTFLYDGTMLILSHADGVATQYLVDAEGDVVDQRDLPGDFAGEVEELVTYYPW